MRFEYEETFLADVLREQAAARGELRRFQSLVEAREDDGLDVAEALLDAGQAMGLLEELDQALSQALGPLSAALDDPPQLVQIHDDRASQPTLHVLEDRLRLHLMPASFEALATLTQQLAERLADAPERAVVTVAAGLGGTGGCAAGECLPEDAAAGPLFERLR